jgi:alkanesulfonate monooxygenase SsuD/methylene tetrahydromethanopterin reductase-like flavin-dependent oxidoreductase (luciferase family)
VGDFACRGAQFDIAGRFSTPRSPQGHPVVLQAGESPAGRDFAASRDGFILGSHVSPSGLDEVVDRVVPELRDRGVLRSAYTVSTQRENLGLQQPRTLGEHRARRSAS